MRNLAPKFVFLLAVLCVMPVWAQPPAFDSRRERPANFSAVLATLDDELRNFLQGSASGVLYSYPNGSLTVKYKPRKFMVHELPMANMITTADSYAPAVEAEGPDAIGFILRAKVFASQDILQKPPEFYAAGQYWKGKGWRMDVKGPQDEHQTLLIEFSLGSKLSATIEKQITAAVDATGLQHRLPTPKFIWNPLVEKLKQQLDGLWPELPLAAKVELVLDTKNNLEFRYDPQKFMVHHPTMLGEFQPASEEVGPRLKGFVIQVEFVEGNYNGMAAMPQTLKGPYYETFLNAYAINGQDAHFYVRLAFGRRCPSEVRDNILKAIEELARKPH